jgi:hypothetical protein
MARKHPRNDDDWDEARGESQAEPDESRANRELRPPRPSGWRDVLRPDYDYPDEIEEFNLRGRRRAKREWRRNDHAERMAWLRDKRSSEPASPAGLIAVAALLAIVLLGFGGGLSRLVGGDNDSGRGAAPPAQVSTGPTTDASPSDTPAEPTATSPRSPDTSQSLPVTTERPQAQEIATADQTVRSWAQLFYARDPGRESYDQLVERAARFTTEAVATSFANAGDPTYEALRTSRGVSRVARVDITAPRPDTAPVNTPSRISRLVTITVDVSGGRPGRLVVPLLTTLGLENGRWVISEVNGGPGT